MDVYRFKGLGFRLPQGSGLIKAKQATKMAAANDIITAAMMHAEEIIQDARKHLEDERVRGYSEGRQNANADALERLLAEQSTLDAHLTDIEKSLGRLVMASVRKIIHDFDHVALAEALIHNGLTKVRREKRVQIRVPEALTDDLRARVDSILTAFPQIEFADVVEDPILSSPSIIIETAIGRIDCDVSTKLNHLDVAITNAGDRRLADTYISEEVSDG